MDDLGIKEPGGPVNNLKGVVQCFSLQVKPCDSPDSLKNIKAQYFEPHPPRNVFQRMLKGIDTILHKECLKEQKLFNLEFEETWELFVLVYFHMQVRDTNSKWFKKKADVLVQGLKLCHQNLVFLSSSLGSTLLCVGFLVSRVSPFLGQHHIYLLSPQRH